MKLEPRKRVFILFLTTFCTLFVCNIYFFDKGLVEDRKNNVEPNTECLEDPTRQKGGWNHIRDVSAPVHVVVAIKEIVSI